jgi:prepilin-type processing-associated H-X9-DG protein
MYGFNSRMDPNNTCGFDCRFRRAEMTEPTTTILLAEGSEGADGLNYSVNGGNVVGRHSGGGNFVMGDGHSEWVAFNIVCRQGNGGCPPPLGLMADTDSSSLGDWKKGVPYHWFPYKGAST